MQSTGHPLIRRACSLLLAACFVYQLGACPCGCLEHNFWLQAIGFSAHEHAMPSTHRPDGDQLASVDHGHDHDCTGAAADVYVNNARSVRAPEFSQSDWVNSTSDAVTLEAADLRRVESPRNPHDFAITAKIYTRLQVFLI